MSANPIQLSVLMPVYNAGGFLRPALDSVFAQNRPADEVIVIDDGSTDGSLDLLREYEAAHPTMQVLTTTNGGGARAMNLAAEKASHPWLAVMHADDIALPERFERQLTYLEANPDTAVLGTHAFHINEAGERLGLSRFGPVSVEDFNAEYTSGADINVLHPTAILNREVFLRVDGYDPRMRSAEDAELFARMAHHGPVIALQEPLLEYRHHGGSNTLKRFWLQRQLMRFIRQRRWAEIAGDPPLTYDAFLEADAKRPAIGKWCGRYRDFGLYSYRQAAGAVSKRAFGQAARHLVGATLCAPDYTLRKLWVQKFGGQAQRAMADGG